MAVGNAPRALRLCLAVVLVSWWGAAGAGWAAGPDLYRARTKVTGQTEEGRGPALARCFADVLVKVSGDARLLNHPGAATMAKEAGGLVTDLRYRDLMADLPVHDEQGTRDRPYELTATFDPAGIDAALAKLGRKPWTAARPRVAVFLSVQQGTVSYVLTADGSRGTGMREALAEAADRVGLPALVPSEAALARSGLRTGSLSAADRRSLAAAAEAAGGDIGLAGRLVWSERALGWVVDWRLDSETKTHRWRLRGVNFDEAFRNAMRGTAQILSGHGPPR
jgi:uncharacterized protein